MSRLFDLAKLMQATSRLRKCFSTAASAIAGKLTSVIMSFNVSSRILTMLGTCQRWARSRATSTAMWSGSLHVELMYRMSRNKDTPAAEESCTLMRLETPSVMLDSSMAFRTGDVTARTLSCAVNGPSADSKVTLWLKIWVRMPCHRSMTL